MAKAIWKEKLVGGAPVQQFRWPAGSRALHLEVVAGEPCVWFLCDPSQPKRPRTFLLVPTGGPYGGELDELIVEASYVGTFVAADGGLVGHFFETDNLSETKKTKIEECFSLAGKNNTERRWAT